MYYKATVAERGSDSSVRFKMIIFDSIQCTTLEDVQHDFNT